jgi:vacuolar-type H+-ATPase subunit E/Vma4
MEELQSTKILDREILEDARKKAYRILKAADDTVKANAQEWAKKSGQVLGELKARWDERLKTSAAEIMARLPLDKRRAKSEIIERLLKSAVDAWFESLSGDEVLGLLEKELSRLLNAGGEFLSGAAETAAGEAAINAVFHNLSRTEGEAVLKKKLSGKTIAISEAPSALVYPEIILTTKKVRITASINIVLDEILHNKREELVKALIGEAARND